VKWLKARKRIRSGMTKLLIPYYLTEQKAGSIINYNNDTPAKAQILQIEHCLKAPPELL
jgi:hypothetical protein